VILTPDERDLLADARRATLATIAADGRPRLVPICFVVTEDVIWSPIDEKPKSTADPLALARVRDMRRRPDVAVLVDRWSEDWTELAWLRIEGHAELVASEESVIQALRAKYVGRAHSSWFVTQRVGMSYQVRFMGATKDEARRRTRRARSDQPQPVRSRRSIR
jgi:PPOX class probable F420-dependent enzyme